MKQNLQWSDVSLKLNNQLVEQTCQNYAYKAYLLSNFAQSKEVKENRLCFEELLYADDSGSLINYDYKMSFFIIFQTNLTLSIGRVKYRTKDGCSDMIWQNCQKQWSQ